MDPVVDRRRDLSQVLGVGELEDGNGDRGEGPIDDESVDSVERECHNHRLPHRLTSNDGLFGFICRHLTNGRIPLLFCLR